MTTRIATDRRWGLPTAVGFVVLLMLALAGCGDGAEESGRAQGDSHRVAERDVMESGSDDGILVQDDAATLGDATETADSAPAAAPVAQRSRDLAQQRSQEVGGSSLEIPAIGVSTPLITLGLNADRTMQVPANFARAGWYKHSPIPGAIGPSVIAGHVDSRSGPAVFYRLKELAAGDRVTVRYGDGRTAEFAVDRIEQHPKDAFPHDRVYGETAGAELRLITCGGIFDPSRSAHRDNVIVYATLVS